jgi:hypothetical protein
MNVSAIRGLDPTDQGALRLVQKKIWHEMNEMADRVAGGEAKDYAGYKQLTGIIEGLALCERIVIDVLEMQMRSSE